MSFLRRIGQLLGILNEKAHILVVGLDNSGKTTIINQIKPGKKTNCNEVTPTVGFHIDTFSKDGIDFTVFDMSGQGRYRSLWEHHYSEVQAIIFVIDCTDKIRICVVKDELQTMLKSDAVSGTSLPIVFFANKMDLTGAMTPVECMHELGLDSITQHPWHITATNAVTGQGIEDGIAWMVERVRNDTITSRPVRAAASTAAPDRGINEEKT